MGTDTEEMEGEDADDLVEISKISEVEISDQDKDEQEGDKNNMMVVMASAVELEVQLEEVGL